MDRNVLILGQSPLAEALAELIGAAGLVVHRPPAWPETREDLDAIFTDQDRGNTICATWARHTGRPTW